ncbi:ankyrin repeat domain-containing protein [Endozoicomonas ascidiicola]|uniref:ankyrin repeat domain-containing protein n=1 Tax=Endozoicomonas ascidiicola TaxID=1698521 RepID=UPI0012FE2C5C|nr:ankyrin repeat domain-containing protein [Endozoicomonas ascidiicola]
MQTGQILSGCEKVKVNSFDQLPEKPALSETFPNIQQPEDRSRSELPLFKRKIRQFYEYCVKKKGEILNKKLSERNVGKIDYTDKFSIKGVFKHLFYHLKTDFIMKTKLSEFYCLNKRCSSGTAKPEEVENLKAKCEKRTIELFKCCEKRQVLALDYGNGYHSAIIIRPENGPVRYFSYGSRSFNPKIVERFGLESLDKITDESSEENLERLRLYQDIVGHADLIDNGRMELIKGLDTEKMIWRAKKLFENGDYRYMTNNCSSFVAKVIKSGVRGVKPLFENRRVVFQMPETTVQFSREVNQYLSGGKIHQKASQMTKRIEESGSFNDIEHYYSGVVAKKKKWSFKFQYFFWKVFKVDFKDRYYIVQAEKAIGKYLLASGSLKNELFDHLYAADKNKNKIKSILKMIGLKDKTLSRLIKLDDVELLQFYFEHFDASLNSTLFSERESLLMHAINNGSNNVFLYLMENGANCEAVDKDGNNALMRAAKKGNLEAVNFLLEMTENLQQMNRFGKTALDMAAKYTHHDVVKVIKAHQAMNKHPSEIRSGISGAV